MAQRLPPLLIGTWNIGKPYDTPGPIGIDDKEEELILGLHVTYSGDHLHVCGKNIPAEPLEVESLTTDDFLRKYGFIPDVIGLRKATITDVTLNASHRINACNLHGVYEAPGAHVFKDKEEHFVMEIGNAYFPLRKG
jgi:hypothetical protein